MEIKSKDITLVEVQSIKPWHKNRNQHSSEQIERLANLIKYQGFRNPLVISNQTGFLIAGHGRLEAAKKLGMTQVPVVYQDFENDEQAYAYMVSDNAIADWAELDLSSINSDLGDLGPDFNLEMLGIKDFMLDVAEKIDDVISEPAKVNKTETCPNCGFELKSEVVSGQA